MSAGVSATVPFHVRRTPRWGFLVVLGVVLSLGCTSSRLADLRPVPHNPLAERFQIKSWKGAKPSDRTLLALRKVSLDERIWRRMDTRPQEIITDLTKHHDANPQLETVYALAELNYIAGGRREKKDEKAAIDYYLACLERCEQYLFDPQFDGIRNPYDPEFRGACDLYNSALENCLRTARKDGLFKSGGKVTFAAVGHKLQLKVDPKGIAWNPEEIDSFEFVSDYQLNGLANKYQTHGLGVPLIAIRKSGSAPPDLEKYYARNLSFPVTAFLRLKKWDKPGGANADPDRREAVLELYDPLDSTDIQLAGLRVPLESDITTPLAYFLDSPDVRKLDALGLVRVDQAKKFAGLYMVQPYQPGKIPVLMVHGLYSSPMTWLEAFNDLRSNPELREKYQFWFYLYPSGQPFWESAADLREHLAQTQKVFDKNNDSRSFENMVLVGHSMGGLISRMVTQDSGDKYWNAVSARPFQQVKGDPETLKQFERVYFFDRVPTVSRVVTIGSPHRGSEYANDFTQKIARNVIYFPKKSMEMTARVVTMNPNLFRSDMTSSTSLDSLDPDSPILRVLAESPKPKGVAYHNIVGITKHDIPLEKNTDGVVPYSSAHRTDVESELVIRADHTHVHRDPRTVNELARILTLHLRELDGSQQGGIQPIGGVEKPATSGSEADGEEWETESVPQFDRRLIPNAESIYRDGTGLDDWRPAEEGR